MLQADRVRFNGTVERNAKRLIAARGSNRDRIKRKDCWSTQWPVPPRRKRQVVAILGVKRVQVVHRLDHSSGVLVFAKNADARTPSDGRRYTPGS